MNDIKYKYCDNDLLINSQNYQMSQFAGVPFLEAYIEFREELLKKFITNKFILSQTDLITKLNLENYKGYDVTKIDEYESISILSWILFDLFDNTHNLISDNFINIFIKKFEVKKKIYSKYSKEFKENSENFTVLRNYLLLSIICLIKYQRTLNLKFLNTTLKINDILCSQKNFIYDSIDSELFIYTLENEIHNIKQFYKKINHELKK